MSPATVTGEDTAEMFPSSNKISQTFSQSCCSDKSGAEYPQRQHVSTFEQGVLWTTDRSVLHFVAEEIDHFSTKTHGLMGQVHIRHPTCVRREGSRGEESETESICRRRRRRRPSNFLSDVVVTELAVRQATTKCARNIIFPAKSQSNRTDCDPRVERVADVALAV